MSLFFHVAFEHLTPDDRAVYVAPCVHTDTLSARVIGHGRFRVFDERRHLPVPGAADANPLLDAGELMCARIGPGFRVRDIDGVVPGDEDAARPAELPPFVEVLAVLIEDLDPVVLAIPDEQAPARGHRDSMGLGDPPAARNPQPPLPDGPPPLAEPDDAV